MISILTTPDAIDEYKVTPDDFTNPTYKKTYAAMLELIDSDEVITFGKILTTAQLDITRADNIARIVNEARERPEQASARFYIPRLKELSKQRAVDKIIVQYQSGEINLDQMQDKIDHVVNESERNQERRMTYAQGVALKFEEMGSKTPKNPMLKTGFKDLDLLTGGIAPRGKLIIIAARPSVGKTAFTQQLIEQLTTENPDTTGSQFNLEMENSDMMDRTVARTAKIEGRRLRFIHDLDIEEMKRFSDRAQIMADIPIAMYEASGDSMPEIRRKVKKEMQLNPSAHHIVMVDHLGLVRKHTNEGRNDLDVGAQTWGFKMMAKQLGVTILLLSQLSRKVEERQDKRPTLADLRNSGDIEQDADAVWFLYRDDYYNAETEDSNTIEVIVAKHRDGAKGTVKLGFRKEYSHILGLERSNSYGPPA